ncbi:hypothetical protein [Escherichia coli]|uniref:GntT/GntP/DsdX family permease n=1 Tax=Escherichia coli TaxID=562 RepID=UPI003AF30F68
MLNPSVTAEHIMPSALRGWFVRLPLFFEVAIVLLISVAFSMARHTGTNLVKTGNPINSQAWRPRLRSWYRGQRQCCWHRR